MKQPFVELSDTQKAALYSEAKKLAAIGSIGGYERAASILSQIRGWRDSDKIAEFCLRKIMVLQAQTRQKRKKIAKGFLLPLAAVLLFAFLMFRFVFPDIRYASSSKESVGSDYGMLSGTDGFSSERLPENGSFGGRSDADSAGRTPMAEGDFDAGDYNPDSITGKSHPDTAGLSDGAPDRTHGTAESASVSSGKSGSAGDDGASSGKNASSGQKNDTGSQQTSSGSYAPAADGSGSVRGNSQDGSSAKDYGDDDIRSGSADEPGSEDEQDFEGGAQERRGNQNLRTDAIYVSAFLAVVILGFLLYKKLLRPAFQYRRAVKQIRSGNYPEAIRMFGVLNGYRDSARRITYCETKIKDADYSSAIALKESGRLEDAIAALDRLGNYKDSEKQKNECRQAIRDTDYKNAVRLMEAGSYEDAASAFRALDGYKNSEELILQCKTGMEREPVYREAVSLAEAGNRAEAERLFGSLRGFRDSDSRLQELRDGEYADALALKDSGDYSAAISAFEKLSGYRDSLYQIESCKSSVLEEKYRAAVELKNGGRYEDAIDLLNTLSGLPQAKDEIAECKKLIVIPRPFAQYAPAAPENTSDVSGERQERTVEDVQFLDSHGTLTLATERGSLMSASWGSDFFWKTQNVKNRGKSAEKQYRKFVSYYASLFGPPVSEYSANGHKGSWWKTPAVTVDCSTNSYISIHFDAGGMHE